MIFLTKLNCFYPNCKSQVIASQRTKCRLCREVRCPEHNQESYHDCLKSNLSQAPETPEEKTERDAQIRSRHLKGLLRKLEIHRISMVQAAEALRHNHQCSLLLPNDSQAILDTEKTYGAINIHFPLVFDDGVKWLIRVRQAHHGLPPLDILTYTAISEVATLQTLHSFGMLVPNAWMPRNHVTGDTNSDDSFCYFFCEHLPGQSLTMRPATHSNFREVSKKDQKLIEEYGKYQICLSNHPLPYSQIGSLVPVTSPTASSKSTMLGPMMSLWGLNNIESPHFPGPFINNQERYFTQIDIALSHISKWIINVEDTLDAYLWHLTLRELVSICPELAEEDTEVYIRHADAKGDILWGDEEGSLTGILDWEMAYVTTKAEAFSAPLFCYNTRAHYGKQDLHTPREIILMEYYKRENRYDLAECVLKGKKYQYLDSIGRFNNWYGISCSPWALMDAFEDTKPQSLQPPFYISKDWTIYMVDRYQSQNEGLKDILVKVGWNMEIEKERVPKGWEERDLKRSQWWGMSIEDRRRKKRENIAESERRRQENKINAESKKIALAEEGKTSKVIIKK